MRALILTKSSMEAHGASGVCTTAIDMDSFDIYRFVSNKEGGPIEYPYNRRYECLDIVSVDILEKCPISPQTENVLVDQNSFKTLNIPLKKGAFPAICDLINENQASENMFMENASYKLESVELYKHSLEIRRVTDLVLKKNKNGSTKAFFYADTSKGRKKYSFFSVTDPKYKISPDSMENVIGNAYIVVSLPYAPYEKDNCYHKFIAAIYPE